MPETFILQVVRSLLYYIGFNSIEYEIRKSVLDAKFRLC